MIIKFYNAMQLNIRINYRNIAEKTRKHNTEEIKEERGGTLTGWKSRGGAWGTACPVAGAGTPMPATGSTLYIGGGGIPGTGGVGNLCTCSSSIIIHVRYHVYIVLFLDKYY